MTKLNIEFSHNDVETTFKFDSEFPAELKQINESIEFLEELTKKLEGIKDEMLMMKPYDNR